VCVCVCVCVCVHCNILKEDPPAAMRRQSLSVLIADNLYVPVFHLVCGITLM
jgi:hypothetical protein